MIDDTQAHFIHRYHHLLFDKEPIMAAVRLCWCVNKTCTMNQVLLETNRKRCGSCDYKLRNYNYKHDGLLPDDMRPLPDAPLPLLGTGTPSKSDEPMVFESNCDIKGCPIAPKPTISVPFALFTTWVFLAQKYSVEWIAYLKGSIASSGDITIAEDGMYFPIQRATGVHVDAEQNSVEEGTVASIHSHVGMNAFFSKEDEDHFNHPADLVVNRKGEIECVMRQKLECGRFSRVKAIINFVGTTDDVGAVATLRSKLTIEKEQPRPSQTGFTYHDSTRISDYSRSHHGLVLVDNRYASSHHHSDDDPTWADDPRNKHS